MSTVSAFRNVAVLEAREGKSFAGDLRSFLGDNFKVVLITL